jgi:5-methylcytosine-specific restriction endonuclease McrA
MPTKPPQHSLPKFTAPSHARQVYDRQTRRMTAHLKCAADVRNSSFWKAVSRTYWIKHPVCENPHGKHGEFPPLTQEIHHIIPISKAPHLAYKHSNLMALCKKCHAVFNQQERAEERQ